MTRVGRNHQSAAAMLWCGTIVATAVLLSRRMAGEFEMPASIWPAVFVSSCTAIVSLTAWALFQRTKNSLREVRIERLAAMVAWCPAWMSGLAVAPANSSLAQGWLIGVSVLSASLLALLGRWDQATDVRAVAFAGSPDSDQQGSTENPHNTPACNPVESLAVFDPVSGEPADGLTTQWMTRQTRPDGGEHLEGGVRAVFAAGQRSASVHVPFTPPFSAVPNVECEIVGDESARWKVSVVYSYGMRIELKRNDSHEPAEVELAYAATCEHVQSDAA